MAAQQNKCEVFWIQMVVDNGYKLPVGAFYRPHIDDQHSIDALSLSL